jgi:predicted nucleic acid-binding protein
VALGRPVLLLDTNVVLDWLVFGDAAVQPIAAAIGAGRVRLVSSTACVAELQRALGYKNVGLDSPAQARVLAAFCRQTELLDDPAASDAPALPRCEDPDDQKFLELALHAGACWLVSRDKALLKLAEKMRTLAGIAVIAPSGFELEARD